MTRVYDQPYLETGTGLLLGTAFGLALGHLAAGAFLGVAAGFVYELLVAAKVTEKVTIKRRS